MQSPTPLLVPILINKLRKRIDQANAGLLAELRLNKLHLLYLLVLHDAPEGLTMRELSETLGFDKANTSRAVAQLESMGYVERKAQGSLEKKFRLVLTPLGAGAAEKIKARNVRDSEALMKILEPAELETLMGILAKFQVYLDDPAPGDPTKTK